MHYPNQKGFAALEAVLIVIIIALVASTGYYVWHSKKSADTLLNTGNQAAAAKPAAYKRTTTTPSDWKTYTNPTYALTLSYPAGWHIEGQAVSPGYGDDFSKHATNKFDLCYLQPGVTQTCVAQLLIMNQTLNDTVAQAKANYYDVQIKHAKESRLTIDGHPAVEFSYNQGKDYALKDYYLYAHGYTYVLPSVYVTGLPGDPMTPELSLTIFESIHIK